MKLRLILLFSLLVSGELLAQSPMYAPTLNSAKVLAEDAKAGTLISVTDGRAPAQFRLIASKPAYATEDNFWYVKAGSQWMARIVDSTQTVTVYDSLHVKNAPVTRLRYDGSDWVVKTGNKASNGGTILRASASRYWERKLPNRTLDIRSFAGVVPSTSVSGSDVSGKFQVAVDYLNAIGGGTLYVGAWEDTTQYYLFKYPVFVPSNVNIVGDGKATRILANISVNEGRVAFLVGNSREWNRAVTAGYRAAGGFGWIENTGYTDVPKPDGMTIKSYDSRIVSRNVQIRNLYIKFDYTGKGSNWGGYGVQFAHAADCTLENIWSENACQAFGVGSDAVPSTPACVNITIRNIHVVKPDPVHTYYAIGFVANSNNVLVENCDSPVKLTAGSPEGSIIATAAAKNVTFRGIVAACGRSQNAQAIFINDSQDCVVENCVIDDAKDAVATFFFNLSYLSASHPNTIRNVVATGCDNLINAGSKYDRFENIQGTGYTNSIKMYNINTSGNTFVNVPRDKVAPPSGQDVTWPATFNTMPDEFVTISGSIPGTQVNDFNSFIGGFEGGTSAALNAPTASSSHFLRQSFYNSNFIVQEARTIDAADTRIFERKKIGGVWSAWLEKNKNRYLVAGDSAYTVPYPQVSILLSTITANRVLTLPAVSENNRGFYYIYNRNNNVSYNWTTNLLFNTQDGTTETLLRSNEVTILENTGVSYRRVSPDVFTKTGSDARYVLKTAKESVRGVTGTYTLTLNNDQTIVANASGGAFTITLPALSSAYDATTLTGKDYVIKKSDSSANVITIQAAGADLIETAGTTTLTAQDQVIRLRAYSGRWLKL